MKHRPEVSVIMPVFNTERYVAKAIDSILIQSFRDFEFIILNDGSTDGTSKILVSITDNRIRLIERENRGFAYSLNEAISLSKGRYIARMDADDIALENRLQLQYEFMKTHRDVDILGGQAYIIDEEGKSIGELRVPQSQSSISRCIKYLCPMCHPTYFVRKEVYGITGGYRILPPVEDYDFLLRAFEKGCVLRNLPEKVLKYRKACSGMSFSNIQRTIYLTAQIQKMHKLRSRSKAGEQRILSKLQMYNRNSSWWFRLVYNLRERLMEIQKRKGRIVKHLIWVPIIVLSLMHHQVLINGYNAFRTLRWR